MARRGGGSAGRSSGGSFGGSRSIGGRSGGSLSRGRSGSFGGSSGRSGGVFGGGKPSPSSGGGLLGGNRTPRPGGFFGGGWFLPRQPVVIVPTPRVRPHPKGNSLGGQFPGSGDRKDSSERHRPSGCATMLAIIAALIAVLVVVSLISSNSPNKSHSKTGLTASTLRREPLPAGSVNETSYFTDTLGWIGNRTQLLSGLKHFYQKTGVQPHLYITDVVNGSHHPSPDDLDKFAHTLYDKLFTDEAHLLLVFFEYGDGYMDRYVCGTQAKAVIDTEAGDILLDYLDRYYYDDRLTNEEFFSKSFAESADRIMTVTRSPWIPAVLATAAVTLLGLAFLWWKRAKDYKILESQRAEEILKVPLEQFGDTEVGELAKKYEASKPEKAPPDIEE